MADKVLSNPVEDDGTDEQDDCRSNAQLFTDCQEDDKEVGDCSGADLEDIGERQDNFLLDAQLFSFGHINGVGYRHDQGKYRKHDVEGKEDCTT